MSGFMRWMLTGAAVLALAPPEAAPQAAGPEPVIECQVADPTADKPQSKVWYAAGSWWAWLPDGTGGSRVWRRHQDRWRIETYLSKTLNELPNRADVYVEDRLAVAALVHQNRLAVVPLRYDPDSARYLVEADPLAWEEPHQVETVTIDRDAAGIYWVAYPADSATVADSVLVRRIIARPVAPDFSSLGPPTVLADDVSRDDICAVVRMNGAVGVMWSNQREDLLLYARHQAQDPVTEWWDPDTVAAGGLTADDHINFCKPRIRTRRAGELRLFAATKTSLDQSGAPLLAARVFDEEQTWTTVRFAPLTAGRHPSRPTALWLADHPAVAYSVYGDRLAGMRDNWVELQHFAPDGKSVAGEPEHLLGPLPGLNNVTGPKHEPVDVPVLLLAGDHAGRVWEIFVEQGEARQAEDRGMGGGAGGGGGNKGGGRN